MEHRITSLLLPTPETELETSSKDERLCGYVCNMLRSLPEIPTLTTYNKMNYC